MGKRIIGRLPVNVRYTVIDTAYKAKDAIDFSVCDNCGKIISNIAIIENEQNQRYSVGLDCASTMQLYRNDQVFNVIEAKKLLARRARFVKWYRNEYKSHVIENNGIWLYDHVVSEWSSSFTYRMTLKGFAGSYPGIARELNISN